MKPFWKKSGKKKAKTKPKSSSQKSKQPPEPWKPPTKRTMPQKEKTAKKDYQAKREFLKTFNELSRRHSSWKVWSDFVTMSACAISNAVDKNHYQTREELYLRISKGYDKKELDLFAELMAHVVMALENDPAQDFLGTIFMELNLSNSAKGQVFTPYSIAQMMAAMTMSNVADQVTKQGYITINDPCCGAGVMLIAGINEARRQLEKTRFGFQNHVLIVGQDVDSTCVMMSYIQVSMLGMAGYFKVGNSISEPMTSEDNLDNYWFTPVYFSTIWKHRRIFSQVDELLKRDGEKENGKN